jgi:hypothetical protein
MDHEPHCVALGRSTGRPLTKKYCLEASPLTPVPALDTQLRGRVAVKGVAGRAAARCRARRHVEAGRMQCLGEARRRLGQWHGRGGNADGGGPVYPSAVAARLLEHAQSA